MKRERWKQYWSLIVSAVLSIGVAIAIFRFSAQTSDVSDGMSTELARWLLARLSIPASEDVISLCDVILRKTAHFSLYALFGMGLYGVLRWQQKIPAVGAAVALCALYALSDEFHQLFIDGRTGQLLDVGIDVCGALTGTVIAALLRSRWEAHRRRRREQP